MTQKIKFIARDEYGWNVQNKPVPAATVIPQWWRDMMPYDASPESPEGKKLVVEGKVSNATAKKCTPMLDAITSGYIITLYADVQVRQTETGPRITWRMDRDVFQQHGHSSQFVQPPTGYDNLVFKYLNTWIPVTPKGYSVLLTSPMGYRDLPFQAIPGIIDSDRSTLEIVPPMWVKSGFEGIVEAGTPMFQLTPYKRDNWEAEFSFLKEGEYYLKEENSFNKTIVNHYIKKHRSKKTYR